jgi:hypothetical protein
LRGRPYHIRLVTIFSTILPKVCKCHLSDSCFPFPFTCSALYVVDLKKFRETAAGDNLRVFYETLSKDPNSLANLDQVRNSHYVYLFCFKRIAQKTKLLNMFEWFPLLEYLPYDQLFIVAAISLFHDQSN